MAGSSEGSAHPNEVSSTDSPATDALTSAPLTNTEHANTEHAPDPGGLIAARIAAADQLNTATGQRGRSWALRGNSPRLAWQSRSRWTAAVAAALATGEGRQLCRNRHLSHRTALLIARACARFADSRTGHSVTASNRTIGRVAAELSNRAKPFSHDVVANARAVLAELGLAVEVAQGRHLTAAERLAAAVHHDCVQTRVASTWALITPRQWVQRKSDLPRRGSTGSKTPRSKWSPKRSRANARRAQTPSGRVSHEQRALRPQVVTADLLRRTVGLDTGRHIGALVDVISDHVDCSRWSGADLAAILTEDARANALTWPDRIANPAGFLRHRLRRLTDRLTGQSPSEQRAEYELRRQAEQRERAKAAARANLNRASARHVQAEMEALRKLLGDKRNARREQSTKRFDLGSVAHAHEGQARGR